jgi:hypothetical protein
MTFATNSGVLAAAVPNGGQFTIGYPAGRTGGDFSGGMQHQLSIQQRLYNSPGDFTVAFAANLATITWKGANTLPAGSPYRVQFDIAGESPSEFPDITRASRAYLERVEFGTPAATSTVSLRAAAAVAAAGPIALIPAGQTFDVPRNVNISSSGVDTPRVFTVAGRDEYGAAMTETITGVNAATVQGKKAFKNITSISVDAACAGNISAGFGNVLGLPIFLSSAASILAELQDNQGAGAGTKVPGQPYNAPATPGGADVRGTYVPAALPDGVRSYALLVIVSTRNAKGVAQV